MRGLRLRGGGSTGWVPRAVNSLMACSLVKRPSARQWSGVTALLELGVHRAHLAHVAAAVGEGHRGDELRIGIDGELRVEGRTEVAVGHLHHACLVVGGADPWLGVRLGREAIGGRRLVTTAPTPLRRFGFPELGGGLAPQLVHRRQAPVRCLARCVARWMAPCSRRALAPASSVSSRLRALTWASAWARGSASLSRRTLFRMRQFHDLYL